jgi:thiol-disulfide isomerase/thioredoxin/uncharacterized membrane protein YphA (DoxX/SURF4 family)
MADAVLIARLLLVAVFLIAGFSKLADRRGAHTALLEFGLPQPAVLPLAIALPLLELAVALALLIPRSTTIGAIGAFTLLIAFTAAIGANLARGRKPNCHCFGQLRLTPIGPPALARNAGLMAIASFVVLAGPGPSLAHVSSWIPSGRAATAVVAAAFVILAGALAVVGWFVINLVEQRGRLLLRLETVEAALRRSGLLPTAPAHPTAPAVGSPAPEFVVRTASGSEVTRDSLLAPGKALLLVFLDPDCGPCQVLRPEVATWASSNGSNLTIAVVTRDAGDGWTGDGGGFLYPERVLVQSEREVADAFGVFATPAALLIRPDGTIGSTVAAGADAIRGLWRRSGQGVPVELAPPNGNGRAASHADPSAPPLGQAAPRLVLPALSGEMVNLKELYGADGTVVLFWDPACGFCQQMLPTLQAWEREGRAAAKLVVISKGTPEENRAMNLRCPILLDQHMSAARAFGAFGTPSAVLMDAHGRVASGVASGSPAVVALLSGRQEESA